MSIESIVSISLSTLAFLSCVYLIVQNKKKQSPLPMPQTPTIDSPSFPKPISESLLKTVQEQEKKIEFLQAQLSSYKRESQGIYLKWASPREDKSAYLLRLYNDSYEKIHNIRFKVDPKYSEYMKLFSDEQICESQKSLNLFFIPGTWTNVPSQGPTADRITFVEKWIQNKMEPIKFTVEYSTDPLSEMRVQLEILFTKDNLTSNFRNVLHASRNNLTLLP